MRNLATTFPVYIHLGSRTIHPHFFFETLAYVGAFAFYLHLRRRFGDSLDLPIRWTTVAAAIAGAALGSKVLYWLEDPRATLQNVQNPAYLVGGKTIIGALIGGLITVELTKRYIGLRISTGDLYAVPLAIGIAIGRIGCFLTGLSDNPYGTPTTLPWGVDFGDGIPRHPTQLYEIAFLLVLIPLLYKALKRTSSQGDVILSAASAKHNGADAKSKDPFCNPRAGEETVLLKPDARRLPVLRPGDAFKLFMIAYASFRLLDDFIKPYPRIFLGLGGIQWACVISPSVLLQRRPPFAARTPQSLINPATNPTHNDFDSYRREIPCHPDRSERSGGTSRFLSSRAQVRDRVSLPIVLEIFRRFLAETQALPHDQRRS